MTGVRTGEWRCWKKKETTCSLKKKKYEGFKSNKKITYGTSIHYSVKIAEEIWQWLFSHIKNHQNRPLAVRCVFLLPSFSAAVLRVTSFIQNSVTQNEISICTTGRGWKYELARLCKKHRQSLIMWRKKKTWLGFWLMLYLKKTFK